jgi:hypothetical protein
MPARSSKKPLANQLTPVAKAARRTACRRFYAALIVARVETGAEGPDNRGML